MPVLTGRRVENTDLGWRPWTWLGATGSLEYLSQGKNIRFKNKDSILHGDGSGKLVDAVIRMVLDRDALGAKPEAERCFSSVCPTPQGLYTDATGDLRGLMHVQVTACFVDVSRKLFHPKTQLQSMPEFKGEWGKTDRGFQAADPHIQADGFPD